MFLTPLVLLVHCANSLPSFEVLFIGISFQFSIHYCTLKPLQCSLSFWFYPKSQLNEQFGGSTKFVNLWSALPTEIIWMFLINHIFLALLLISRVYSNATIHSIDRTIHSEVVALLWDKIVSLGHSCFGVAGVLLSLNKNPNSSESSTHVNSWWQSSPLFFAKLWQRKASINI